MKILKPHWLALIVLCVGIVYWKFPKSPLPCRSLKQYGSVEDNGRCVIDRNVKLTGNIDRLPDRLTIRGDLNIIGTEIEELPNSLIIEGNLDLYKTSISKFPPDLQVWKNFDQSLGLGSPGVKCIDIPSTTIIHGSRRCLDD